MDSKAKSLMKAYSDFHNTTRTIDKTPGQFVQDFEENYKKLEAQGGMLPFNILAVTLINNANLLEEDLHSFVFVDQHHILMKMEDCCSFLSQEELHQHHQLCDPGVGDLLFQ